jgi:hypothetical protein
MIAVQISIRNIDTLRDNFSRAPVIALKYLARATAAAIFEVEKQAVDSNFQFKTPRALRTGDLQKSFAFGRYIAPGGLQASIGPTVHYAPYVYYGTSRGIKPNNYMDRIADAATPDINKHFATAVDKFVDEIGTV